jgi:hypothetical protein
MVFRNSNRSLAICGAFLPALTDPPASKFHRHAENSGARMDP